MNYLAVGFIVFISCGGCVSPPSYQLSTPRSQIDTSTLATSKTELIREGMSKDEIREIFGQPDQVKSNPLGSSWEWTPEKCYAETLAVQTFIAPYPCKVDFDKEGLVDGWKNNTRAYKQ